MGGISSLNVWPKGGMDRGSTPSVRGAGGGERTAQQPCLVSTKSEPLNPADKKDLQAPVPAAMGDVTVGILAEEPEEDEKEPEDLGIKQYPPESVG